MASKESQQVTTMGFMYILGWLLSLGSFILAIGSYGTPGGFNSSVLFLLSGLVANPGFSSLIGKNFNFQLSLFLRIILYIFLFIFAVSFFPREYLNS